MQKHVVRLWVGVTISDTSVNIRKQQSKNSVKIPHYGLLQIKNYNPTELRMVHLVSKQAKQFYEISPCIHSWTLKQRNKTFNLGYVSAILGQWRFCTSSPSQGKVYCSVYKLISDSIPHLTQAVLMASHRENAQKHRKCIMTYYSRLKISGYVDA